MVELLACLADSVWRGMAEQGTKYHLPKPPLPDGRPSTMGRCGVTIYRPSEVSAASVPQALRCRRRGCLEGWRVAQAKAVTKTITKGAPAPEGEG